MVDRRAGDGNCIFRCLPEITGSRTVMVQAAVARLADLTAVLAAPVLTLIIPPNGPAGGIPSGASFEWSGCSGGRARH